MYYIEEFLISMKQKKLAEKTMKAYTSVLFHFQSFFEKKGITEIGKINEELILSYLEKLYHKTNEKGFYLKVFRLKKYFRFLVENDYLFFSPLADYEIPKYPKTSYPAVAQDDIVKILEGIKTDTPFLIKGKAILELAYSSALRPGEIMNLKIRDIDFKSGLLFIEQAKNQKDRIVPVGLKALKWIRKYLQEVRPKYINDQTHDCVFISHKTGKQLSIWGIRWAVQETLRKNGFDPIKPYSLRPTSATSLLLGGMGLMYISKLLGHTHANTTRIYLRVKTHDLKNIINKKHPRNNQ